jgi:hypothetical protein
MGRKLTEAERLMLPEFSDVAGFSPEHIVLPDGILIDPQDYERTRVAWFEISFEILKFVAAKNPEHQGDVNRLHILARVVHPMSPFGKRIQTAWSLPKEIPEGRWIKEEELTEEKARSAGLFEILKVVQTIPDFSGLVLLNGSYQEFE